MELKDTIKGMTSFDYKERFIAEYLQTKIRYEKLKNLNNQIQANKEVPWNPPCPKLNIDCNDELLLEQQRIMGEYLHILEVRAVIEKIDLTDIYDLKMASKETSSE